MIVAFQFDTILCAVSGEPAYCLRINVTEAANATIFAIADLWQGHLLATFYVSAILWPGHLQFITRRACRRRSVATKLSG